MPDIKLTVNGKPKTVSAGADTPLLSTHEAAQIERFGARRRCNTGQYRGNGEVPQRHRHAGL